MEKQLKLRFCERCGKLLVRNQTRYCSERCARVSSVQSWYPKRGKIMNRASEIGKALIPAYDCKCAVCGWSIQDVHTPDGKLQRKYGLEIHHIVEVKNGGETVWDNLIPLCPNCHKLATVGIYTPEYLASLQISEDEGIRRLERQTFEARSHCADAIATVLFSEDEGDTS